MSFKKGKKRKKDKKRKWKRKKDYFLISVANIGFNAAENVPSKVWGTGKPPPPPEPRSTEPNSSAQVGRGALHRAEHPDRSVAPISP